MTHLLPSKREKLKRIPTFQDVLSFGNDLEDLLHDQREQMEFNQSRRPASTSTRFVFDADRGTNITHPPESQNFAEKIFNTLVELKVSVAQYAMHLTPAVREKVFSDLDDLLNTEDWHEDDTLPRALSFRDFLKWTIYSKRFNWLSLGFSDEGEILVAWKSQKTMLTARYDGAGRVWWTATVTINGEINHTAGDSTLEYFETEARRLD